MNTDGRTIQRPVQHVTWIPAITEKHGYKYFMQNEIFEQPHKLAKSVTVE